jgi:hypothetical protein
MTDCDLLGEQRSLPRLPIVFGQGPPAVAMLFVFSRPKLARRLADMQRTPLSARKLTPSLLSKTTSLALPASITPFMSGLTGAQIASMRVLANNLDKIGAAQTMSQTPDLGLCQPHERALDTKF